MIKATFRQLEIFLAVANSGSFSAAALWLDISQVSVSKQIAALEQNLGCVLFARRTGAAALISADGEKLLDLAPKLLKEADLMPGGASQVRAKRFRPVRVGVGEFLLESYFYPNLATFQLRHPDIELELLELNPSLNTVDRMKQLGVDLAYFSLESSPDETPGKLLSHIDCQIYVSPKRKDIWLQSFPSQPLPMIFPLSGSFFDRGSVLMMNKIGIEFEVAARAQRSATRLDLAIEGVGAVAAMVEAAADAVARGRLVPLDIPPLRLYRYRFRAPGRLPHHVELVERFFSPIVGCIADDFKDIPRADMPLPDQMDDSLRQGEVPSAFDFPIKTGHTAKPKPI